MFKNIQPFFFSISLKNYIRITCKRGNNTRYGIWKPIDSCFFSGKNQKISIMVKKTFLFSILITSFTLFSFSSQIYWLFVNKIGIGAAYVLDQFFPLLISLGTMYYFHTRSLIHLPLRKLWQMHKLQIITITVSILVVHGLILGYYFFGEEPTSILEEGLSPGSTKLVALLRGYHWGTYIVSFILFGTHAWLYNVFILFLFIAAAILLYFFLYVLFNDTISSLIGVLFFVTTPSYLDTFNWQANISGMSLALCVCLFSLCILIRFQKT